MQTKEYKRNWMREWRKNNPQKALMQSRKYSKKVSRQYRKNAQIEWRKNNPEKANAHKIVFIAVRNGSLVKQPCFCGETKVEAHHNDYLKPLEVIWVCRKHHHSMDSLRKVKEKS